MLPREPAERLLASEYLGALSAPPKRREEVVEELVHWGQARHPTRTPTAPHSSRFRDREARPKVEGLEGDRWQVYLRKLADGRSPTDRWRSPSLMEAMSPLGDPADPPSSESLPPSWKGRGQPCRARDHAGVETSIRRE